MITPVFEITQDDEVLWLSVRAPYANIKDTEIDYCGYAVFFYSKPYYLRLHLPCEVADDDTGSADYNFDTGEPNVYIFSSTFSIKIPKKIKGEHFPNLNMISKLLKPNSKPSAEPSVTEIRGVENEEDEEAGCYELDQKEGKEEVASSGKTIFEHGYGFAWRRHGVMETLSTEIGNLLDLQEPDNSFIEDRTGYCLSYDQNNFNPEHYLADSLEENDALKECLDFEIPTSIQHLSDADREVLKDLPRRVLPKLSVHEQRAVALSLIDIFFAYLYDLRTTCGEHTVESGWTMAKLSPTLSFFVKWNNAKEALIGAARRSLCYPLYRCWNLTSLIIRDLKSLLSSDRTVLLHCLIDMRTVLSTSGDYRYLLNDLYMTDYCLWIQFVHNDVLVWLKREIESVDIDKTDLDLDLDDWELEARLKALKLSDNREENVVDSDDD